MVSAGRSFPSFFYGYYAVSVFKCYDCWLNPSVPYCDSMRDFLNLDFEILILIEFAFWYSIVLPFQIFFFRFTLIV